jgi:SAM-dependent methyltransferase
MARDYVASSYWDEIYAAGYDESAVGYPNLARSLNRARYDVERRNVSRALRAASVAPPTRVLDIGSGTGIWIDFWTRHGASEITGVDLTEAAVDSLRRTWPQHRFVQCDVGEAGVSLPQGMDVVSAMSVLLHITDEARFEQALRSLMASVGAGGSLVLVEPLVVHRWWGEPFGPESNSLARPLATYERILREGGFRIVDLRPASCLLINVIDTRREIPFRLWERYWEWLGRLVGKREWLGALVGGLLRPLDLALTSVVANGPSAKVLVAQRAEPQGER